MHNLRVWGNEMQRGTSPQSAYTPEGGRYPREEKQIKYFKIVTDATKAASKGSEVGLKKGDLFLEER